MAYFWRFFGPAFPVEIDQTAAELRRFFDFSKMAAVRHLGFVVCDRTTREGHSVVFIAVQNLVGIDAVHCKPV